MEIIASEPDLLFVPNGYFAYDAALELINYDPSALNTNEGKLSLVHEIAHARLGHFHYGSDFELLLMEIDAWCLTRKLAKQYKLTLDKHFIDHCIETYDNWLSARSTCPSCQTFCLEDSPHQFHCFSCGTDWRVNQRKDRRTIRKVY